MSTAAKVKLQDVADLMEQFAPAGKLEEKFFQIPIDSIAPSPLNPRKKFQQAPLEELAQSIREKGVLQPLTVRPDPELVEHFEIVIGERRWRAAKLAGLAHVPCLLRMMDDEAVLDAQIIENSQREDVSPIEEAAAFQGRLKVAGDAGHKMSVAELAKRIGKGVRWVYDRLDLLKLSEPTQKALAAKQISPGHAAELVGLAPHVQDLALGAIQRENLTVTGLRLWIKYAMRTSAKPKLDAGSRKASQNSLKTADSLDASYSADVISDRGSTIRAPYRDAKGQLWCCTSAFGAGNGKDIVEAEAYRVLRRQDFSGRTRDYNGRCLRGKKARSDPKGFYHGIAVRFRGQKWVLAGPPKTFRGAELERAAPVAKEPTLAEIERALTTSLRGAVPLRVARLSRTRKRGEWLAVLRISAKSKLRRTAR